MSSFLTKLAHNPRVSLGPAETKALHEIILSEKRLIESTQKLSLDRNRSSAALRDWGQDNGPDLSDVLNKMNILFQYISSAEDEFIEHDVNFRLYFKAIRSREESLASLKRNKDSLQSKINSLQNKITKMKEEHKDLPASIAKLAELKDEYKSTELSVMTDEAKLGDFKRATAKDALSLKLGAIQALGEKTTIVAELGRLLLEAIPTERTEPGQPRPYYTGEAKTDDVMIEAQRCISEVVFNPVPTNRMGRAAADQAVHDAGYENGEENGRGMAAGVAGAGAVGYATYNSGHPRQDSASRTYAGEKNTNYKDYSTEPLSLDREDTSSMPTHDQHRSQRESYSQAYDTGLDKDEYRSSLAYMDSDQGHSLNQSRARDGGVFARTEDAPIEEEESQEASDHYPIETVQEEEVVPHSNLVDQEGEREPLGIVLPPFERSLPSRQSASPIFDSYSSKPSSPVPGPPPLPVTERPYVPKEGDGAYHPTISADTPTPIPIPASPVPAALRSESPPPSDHHIPAFAPVAQPFMTPTALTSVGVTQSPPSPPQYAAPLPNSNPNMSSGLMGPRKPVIIRGESALGSKFGDLDQNPLPTSAPRPAGSNAPLSPSAYQGVGTTGYNSRGDDEYVERSHASPPPVAVGGKINAGAFRKKPANTAPLSPPPPFARPTSGASASDSIRDQYLEEEEARDRENEMREREKERNREREIEREMMARHHVRETPEMEPSTQ